MRIQKVISKNNHEYIFVKEYDKFILYKDMITKVKECFSKQELGLIKNEKKYDIKPDRKYLRSWYKWRQKNEKKTT